MVVTKFLLPLGDIVKIREKVHQKDVIEVVSIKLCHVILKTMSWSAVLDESLQKYKFLH